jgi:hypothetical protein
MGGAMGQIGLPTPILELVAEPIGRERLAELCNEERQVAYLGGLNARLQSRVQRNIHVDRNAVFVLRLAESNATVSDMTPTKPGRVLAPPGREPNQVNCKTRLGAQRVPGVELANLLGGPRVMALGQVF